jgi:hypothetical protein
LSASPYFGLASDLPILTPGGALKDRSFNEE